MTSTSGGYIATTTDTGEYVYTTSVDPYYGPLESRVISLEYQNQLLNTQLTMLAEYMLVEKAKRDGLDVVNIMRMLKNGEADRIIAINLVNDALLTEILIQ